MNPKTGLSLMGLTLAMSAMAQVDVTTAAVTLGPEHGQLGGPFTQDPKPETTAGPSTGDTANSTYPFGPLGRVGGPYNDTINATATGFGPNGRIGGPYTNATNHGVTPTTRAGFLTSSMPFTITVSTISRASITKAPAASPSETSDDDFECGIHELTSKDPIAMTPVAAPTPKHVSDLTELADPTWTNATETLIFSIDPITPTGAQQPPIPGTSPIYTTLVPGSDMVLPTGTNAMVTIQAINETTTSVEASRTPVPNPHDNDEADMEEGAAGKAVLSVAAMIAALAAYGI